MKKNGFVFLESILTIVILTSSLLLLYGSFRKIFQSEKRRFNYDEVNYIYRSEYFKRSLLNYDNNILNKLKDNNYIQIIPSSINSEFMNNLINDFEINDIIIVKKDNLKDLKKCLNENNCSLNLSSSFKNYLNSLNIDIDNDYIIAIEYNNLNYSWVSV